MNLISKVKFQSYFNSYPKTTSCLQIVVTTIFLYVITFPSIDLSFGDGIDSPLSWLFNHLLKHDFQSTKNILFPHGPLAFLTYPLKNGLKLFFLFDFISKLYFVYLLYLINHKIHQSTQWLGIFVCSYIFFMLSNTMYTVIFDILLSFLIAHQLNKTLFKYIGFILIAIAFYIKSYSCAIACVIGASYIIYNLIQTRNTKQFVWDGLTLFACIFFVWLVLYHQFSGFVTYCIGIFNLIQDNSSASAVYPENNWYYLIPCLIIALSLPFFNFTKQSNLYGCLSILAIFAAFKHGMSREDINHTLGLWVFILLNFLVFLAYFRLRSWLNISLSIFALCLFYINLSYKGNYFVQPKYEPLGINNLINLTSNYTSLIQNAETETTNKIGYRKLSDSLRSKIANSTIDVYPWDYSIIAINNFNWHPRPVIQSYAAYTSWLDKQDAQYFNSKEAPEFLIWDFAKGLNKNIDESAMSSTDSRYLLNDEPQTILSILSNYTFVGFENNLNLYKKREKPVSYKSMLRAESNHKMNEWISVPEMTNDDVLRAKVSFNRSITQKLKSFFYKDEQFWILLKLSDESIHKYRIVPKNAEDGLWLNPYVFNPNENSKSLYVKQILLTASNQSILNKNIGVQFENIDFNSTESTTNSFVSDFFPASIVTSDTVYFKNTISFDDVQNSNGINWDSQNCKNNDGINQSRSYLLKSGAFSPTFEFKLDSLKYNDIDIKTTCWIKANGCDYTNKLAYVITLEDANGTNLEWNAQNVSDQILNQDRWNLCSQHLNHGYSDNTAKIKVFIWNTSPTDIHMDDFNLIIKGIKK